jgi:hypothetical protein
LRERIRTSACGNTDEFISKTSSLTVTSLLGHHDRVHSVAVIGQHATVRALIGDDCLHQVLDIGFQRREALAEHLAKLFSK